MSGTEFNWRPWGELWETIVTGQAAFERVHGATISDYLLAHPGEPEIVNAAMTWLSSNKLSEIISAYDFARFGRIVDVGGGHGMLLHGILSANPRLRGILADLPSVVGGATALRTGSVPIVVRSPGLISLRRSLRGQTRIWRNQSSMIGTISTLSGS